MQDRFQSLTAAACMPVERELEEIEESLSLLLVTHEAVFYAYCVATDKVVEAALLGHLRRLEDTAVDHVLSESESR